jgi:hypothetical protein
LAGDVPVRLPDAVDGAHVVDHRLGQPRERLTELAGERDLARDGDVGTAVGLGEDLVERPVDLIGEDVRAADHRHPEQDGQGGEERPELVRHEAPPRDADHRVSSNDLITS